MIFCLISILFISITSCNGKTASHDIGIDDSDINSNTFCTIHEKNCEKHAKDLGMTIDEYHI